MTSHRMNLLVAGSFLATSFGVAHAQQNVDFFQRDRYENVRDRYQEAFDPEPVRAGSFLVISDLLLGLEADDNVFAADADEESDIIAVLAPSIDLRSDWSRHELGGSLQVRHREYTDIGSESATDVRGEIRGGLDVTSDFDVTGFVFAADEVEPRRSAFNRDVFAEPINFQTLGTSGVARLTRDRLRAEATYQYVDFQYDDVDLIGGGSEELGERDYSRQSLRGRVSYAVSPDFAVFGQAEINQREYDETVTVNLQQESRDSEGYNLQVGANFELQRLLRGDVAIGFLEDDVDSDAFVDSDGLSLEAEVEWFPTRLTTVTFEAERAVNDSGLIFASGVTTTRYGARVDHELYRNILLFGSARFSQEAYDDFNRDDDAFDLSFGGTYKLNKRVHIDAYFERFDLDSTVDLEDFEQNVIGLALRLYP